MTHACSICYGSGFDTAGRACPYTDVHSAAARFPKEPMTDPVTEHITVHLQLSFTPGPRKLNGALVAALRDMADKQDADFTFADDEQWVSIAGPAKALVVKHF
jgi:hypothetical protein